MVWAVIQAASSESRKTAGPAMSPGSPMRRSGMAEGDGRRRLVEVLAADVGHRRPDEPRRDDVDAHAQRPAVDGQGARERDHAALGGAVRGIARHGDVRELRADQDDRPCRRPRSSAVYAARAIRIVAVRLSSTNERSAASDDSRRSSLRHTVPAAWTSPSSLPNRSSRQRDDALRRAVVRQVGRDPRDAVAARADFLQRLCAAAGGDHRGALRQAAVGDRAARCRTTRPSPRPRVPRVSQPHLVTATGPRSRSR